MPGHHRSLVSATLSTDRVNAHLSFPQCYNLVAFKAMFTLLHPPIIIIIIIIIQMPMFMVLSSWQNRCDSSPGSFDECRTAASPPVGCQSLHPPSPFIIITQPESWYSFYRPVEGRRLSRPSWLVTYRDGLPAHRRSPISILTGSDVAQLRWSRPTRYH